MTLMTTMTTAVANQVRTAYQDPLALATGSPIRSLLHRHTRKNPALACLNVFLRSELAAVAIIRVVAERMEVYPFEADLLEMLASHERRAELLRKHISSMEGMPTPETGRWITTQRLLGRLAMLISERTALRLISGREALALRTYRAEHTQLDEPARRLTAGDLLVEQERSVAIMQKLNRTI